MKLPFFAGNFQWCNNTDLGFWGFGFARRGAKWGMICAIFVVGLGGLGGL